MPDGSPTIDRVKRQIVQRLSLRKPQEESLNILADVLERIELSKEANPATSLTAIQEAYHNVVDFERDFPSLCFALATGVGKTRLMGAFITYLFLKGKSKHFMVLAPNTTIYEKLIADFAQGSSQYVFKGILELTHNPPVIVTGDNWDNGKGVQGSDLFDSPIINIFNVDKINKDKGRIRKMQEYIGESYFDYLAALPDLVMFMDEAHRYRAKAGMTAIAELKPVLGLEVTATPKTAGTKPKDFKNVIYHYPLGNAINDGFVKEPAVATRADFHPKDITEEQLQLIKLEDGIHCHENTRTKLAVYANNHDLQVITPFMLIVAQDTTHSRQILKQIQSNEFFGGRYKDKVIEINSALRGEENEEATTRLLELEHTAETEIVIHVNKLKEGWDVTNLYTIVPLRASTSEILTEQTLGRGLRLPYGKRTRNEVVDTLTVIAHDRYDDVIRQAKDPNSVVQMKSVIVGGDGIPTETTEVVSVPSKAEVLVTGQAPTFQNFAESASGHTVRPPTEPIFKTMEEQKIASTALEIIKQQYDRRCKRGWLDLNTEEIKLEITQSVEEAVSFAQGELEGVRERPDIKQVVDNLVKEIIEHTIEIPEIVIIPMNGGSFKFNDFNLSSLSSIKYQPISDQIKITQMRTQHDMSLSHAMGTATEDRFEDYILRHLIGKDMIDYESHADLLYKLAGQAVGAVKSNLPDPKDQENVCLCHGKKIADFIFEQMKAHCEEKKSKDYRVEVTRGFTLLRPQNYSCSKDRILDFRKPANPIRDTKKYLFGGFGKCCFHFQKFDSEPERQFAELIDSASEVDVVRWMKPAENQFQIEYETGRKYHPDFVLETCTEILIVEVKAKNEMDDEFVKLKARAARRWVYYANKVARDAGKKKWFYLLVPHDEIRPSSTLAGIKMNWTQPEFDGK